MSGAFIAAVGESFENAAVTVDWFHVVQLFTKAVDEVRRAEARQNKLPKALRWAVLKRADGRLTEAQVAALAELEASDLFTAIAWRIKEKLRWVRQAQSVQAARWRLTNFLRHANDRLDPDPLLDLYGRLLEPSRHTASGSCSAGPVTQQRPPGRAEWPVPGGQGTRSRLPLRHHFRHHHLPDCRTTGNLFNST